MLEERPSAHCHANHRAGVRWSLAGFVVVGISGLLLNLIVNNQYGSTILGQFNVLLAVFIIGGQVGSMGIQTSVLFHTPQRVHSVARHGRYWSPP